MILTYFKIWLRVVSKTINFKLLSKFLAEHLVIFFVIYYFTNYDLFFSFISLLILMIIRSAIRIVFFYKKLIQSDSYDLILLKPIHPLVGLIIYNRNPADILFLLLVLIYIKLRMLLCKRFW